MDAPGGFQAGHVAHGNIQQDDVGLALLYQEYGFTAVAGFGDHYHIRLAV